MTYSFTDTHSGQSTIAENVSKPFTSADVTKNPNSDDVTDAEASAKVADDVSGSDEAAEVGASDDNSAKKGENKLRAVKNHTTLFVFILIT